MCSSAQFTPDFLMSQFSRMEYMRNPAAAGLTPGNNLHLFTRNDLPTIYTNNNYNYLGVSFDGANDSSQLGFGLLGLFAREIAITTTQTPQSAYSIGLDGSFSYASPLDADVRFRIGGSIGLRVKSVPVTSTANGLAGVDSRLLPAFSFGVMVTGDRFRAGASAYNLTNTTVTFQAAPQIVLIESRLYLLQGSFTLYEDDVWKLEPVAAIKVKQRELKPIVDVAITGSFAHRVLFGAGARVGAIAPNYAIAQLGAIFGDYEIVLSYDFPLASAGVVALKYIEATVSATL
jgi:type IX secretion system PorP/SprF family membrane protein